jgi:hypothetical protein
LVCCLFVRKQIDAALKMTSSLIVPLVIWGRQSPTHCISSILMTPDQVHIVTGCNDGQLCVWDVTSTDNWKVVIQR